MGTLIGREAEQRRLASVLAASRTERTARAIRIAGPPGAGKTSLAAATEAHAATEGWLVVSLACHHIQASLPLFLARRTLVAIIAALGDAAGRYTAGLESEESAGQEETFYRVLEGVTLDHPLLLSIDDAQWADSESRSLVARTLQALADRNIVLLSSERSDELHEAAFELFDVELPLSDLSPGARTAVARVHYPNANTKVLDSIVEHAGGHALDIVTIATAARESGAQTAADVAASLRTVIAKAIAALPKEVRDFLQVCAFISEPIEYALLRQLWSDEARLLSLIQRASGRYLVQSGATLRFVHGEVAQAVRETIAIEIPLRRRIMAALNALPSRRLEDFERLVEQAAACGDRVLERDCLMQLADAANAVAALSLEASALERAMEIAPPGNEQFVEFFTRLSRAYNFASRVDDNIRILHGALLRAESEGITTGVGTLIASLLFAEWFEGDRLEFDKTFAHFEQRLVDRNDRAELLSVAAIVAWIDCDSERLASIKAEVRELLSPLPAIIAARLGASDSGLKSRLGHFREAQTALVHMRDAHESFAPAQAMYEVNSRLITFLHLGPFGFEEAFGTRDDPNTRSSLHDMLRIVVSLARGEAEDILSTAGAALVRNRDRSAQRTIRGLLATAHVLLDGAIVAPRSNETEADIRRFVSDRNAPTLPLAMAWSAILAQTDTAAAKELIDIVLDRMRRPAESAIMLFPILLPIAAHRAHASEALALMTDPEVFGRDAEAWNVDQRQLASLVAAALLDRRVSHVGFSETSRRFQRLGAPLFERLASGGWGTLIERGGKSQKLSERKSHKVTRREHEVASLVAEGITNREIAERLFLSERTVEAHIANLFAKVNVNSRTQLASWYLKSY